MIRARLTCSGAVVMLIGLTTADLNSLIDGHAIKANTGEADMPGPGVDLLLVAGEDIDAIIGRIRNPDSPLHGELEHTTVVRPHTAADLAYFWPDHDREKVAAALAEAESKGAEVRVIVPPDVDKYIRERYTPSPAPDTGGLTLAIDVNVAPGAPDPGPQLVMTHWFQGEPEHRHVVPYDDGRPIVIGQDLTGTFRYQPDGRWRASLPAVGDRPGITSWEVRTAYSGQLYERSDMILVHGTDVHRVRSGGITYQWEPADEQTLAGRP